MITIKRDQFTQQSTVGRLSIDDEFQCFTLEPVTRDDNVKPRAIPDGAYTLDIRFSPKHGRDVPHVENVPGFEEIEIHIGNFPKDTEGCCLVGKTRSADFVGQSHGAFDDLFARLQELCPTQITYAKSEPLAATA
jgi:Family of unknown function (DUF5675)